MMGFKFSYLFLLMLPFLVLGKGVYAQIESGPQLEKVEFKEVFPEKETLEAYPFLKDVFDGVEEYTRVNINMAKLEGAPLRETIVIVSIESSYTCGSRGCSIEYYKKLEDGSFQRVPLYQVSRGNTFKLVCGSDLFLIAKDAGPKGHGKWKYDPDMEELFVHVLNTKDFNLVKSCDKS